MPRRGNVSKRIIQEDPVYKSVLVQKFIHKVMTKGKKSKAENIVYSALDEIKKKLNKDPLEVFDVALGKITPMLEVKARRVGGATYQVPIEVSKSRGQGLAMKWLCTVCQERAGKSMIESLAAEVMDAYNGAGACVKKKEDLHKTAEANKAFAHFRW
ncbi:30S ribosomal protein S7 [candidate division WOR-1 bacterium RIFCSPLOWO2_02_FULL_46_20]|uniref:Small ribosomal subunit protein uS7 n=2 Tax=Saganbacteria TaxID=1703751 RepID=A0A1F4R511_UNCSA|nr:MAG: 30S ribosomal protein S7 [candidate division WOR-1 bacterium RIFCSPHIGHO2_02_FULL_45_12]OGC03278.1 MAG: 30S ribosomal protein S7 [candidate division WOR-1 bacterium RIFCSPLOWO2_02_FULL_46_20]OGC08924.1 MAG: 30S ribosomal protein S7 [candidate division WOR-1 bacterium RIFCSPLOWO2_12_FULL_45_9]